MTSKELQTAIDEAQDDETEVVVKKGIHAFEEDILLPADVALRGEL